MASTNKERSVRLTDSDLLETAAKAVDALDWSSVALRQHSSRALFSQSTMPRSESLLSKSREGKKYMCADSIIACSIAELLQVLSTRSNELYTMTMRELHGEHFVFGRIAHSVGQTGSEESTHVDVKIAKFAGRHALARDEQWYFVEGLRFLQGEQVVGDKCFVVTRTSLNPDDVLVGRPKGPVNVLNDINVTYVVQTVPRDAKAFGPPSVLVDFQAEFNAIHPHQKRPQAKLWRDVSERALVARLRDMAATTQTFPQIIRRRRLCAQVFINVKAFRPPNTRCICCSRQLTIIMQRHKKQCHLCGFFACKQCSSHHQVIRSVSVRVCNNCMARVDDAIYDNLPAETLAPASVVPDVLVPSGKLERLLQDALSASELKEKAAAKAVIRTVVGLDSEGDSIEKLSELSSDESYVNALQRLSDYSDTTSTGTYDLASPVTRDYPLEFATDAGVEDPPQWPTPPDDAERMEWYNCFQPDFGRVANIPELELVCELASKELNCPATAITVISDDTQYVLASNAEFQRNGSISRTHTICAHTILEKERPLLVPHPEADVRFSRTEDIRSLGIRFYFGFPITSGDGVVIGTFCTIDSKSHPVTQSQFAFVSRLARCASRIVQCALSPESNYSSNWRHRQSPNLSSPGSGRHQDTAWKTA